METTEKNEENQTSSRVLWVILSALGVLVITFLVGFILFLPQGTGTDSARVSLNNNTETTDNTRPAVTGDMDGNQTQEQPAAAEDPFDVVEWAESSGDFPDLEAADENAPDEFVVNWTPENNGSGEVVIESVKPSEKSGQKPVKTETSVKKTEPAAVTEKVKTVPQTQKIKSTVYWVQVASFSSQFKAEMLSESLYQKGIPVTIQTQDVNGTTWYRIRVGAFSSKEEAGNFQKQLEGFDEIKDSYIVQGFIMKEVPVSN